MFEAFRLRWDRIPSEDDDGGTSVRGGGTAEGNGEAEKIGTLFAILSRV